MECLGLHRRKLCQSICRKPRRRAITYGRPRLCSPLATIQCLGRQRHVIVWVYSLGSRNVYVGFSFPLLARRPLIVVICRLVQNALAVKFGHRIVYLLSVFLVCNYWCHGLRTFDLDGLYRCLYLACGARQAPTSPPSASSSLPQPTSDHPHPGVRPNPKHPLGPHAVHLLLDETPLVSAP